MFKAGQNSNWAASASAPAKFFLAAIFNETGLTVPAPHRKTAFSNPQKTYG
jgi:hypothetical protein